MLQGKLILSGILTSFSGICIAQDNTGSRNATIPRILVYHPIHYIPFIPASSFRGAIRHLMQKQNQDEKIIAEIFGQSVNELSLTQYPGRVIFRDIFLTQQCIAQYHGQVSQVASYTQIDRVTAQNNCFAIEQIPAGYHFRFEILFSIYCHDDIKLFIYLLEALQNLENFSLGGQGTRGLGKIKFGEWKVNQMGIIQNELLSGIHLTWRSQHYYCSGENEQMICSNHLKLKPQDAIQYLNGLDSKKIF